MMPNLVGFSLMQESIMSETTKKEPRRGWHIIKKHRPDIPLYRFMNAYAQLSSIIIKVPDQKSAKVEFYKEICELLLIGAHQQDELDEALSELSLVKSLYRMVYDDYKKIHQAQAIEKKLDNLILAAEEYKKYRDEFREFIDEGIDLFDLE